MKSTPLVSILMTAFNREQYIAEAINSVLKSTYQNWELIILDDASTDKTVEIAKTFASKDERIKLFVNPSNLGQFKNRNKIVDYAKGKYLKYLDSDDLIYPYGLEQLVFYMEQFSDAGYGLCSIEQDNKQQFPLVLDSESTFKRHFFENKQVFHKAPLSSIIKTEVFKALGGFPHEAVSGDFAMWCALASQYTVVLMPHGIVWYRVHDAQEMQKTRDSVLVEFEYLKVEAYYLRHSNCPLDTKAQQRAIQINVNKQNRYILWKLRQHGLKTAWKLWNFKNKGFNLNKAS